MKRVMIASTLILASGLSLNAMADDPVAGAIIGGGAGAIIGHAMGGRNGTAVGGVLGAVIGASVASNNNGREYRHYDDDSQTVVYTNPAPVAYAPPPAVVYAPPPQVVYTPPPQVVYTPPVTYYRPAPVVVYQRPYYSQVRYVVDDDRHDRGWHRGWDHRRWGRDDDDRDHGWRH
jgi:hypothetical protein